VRRQVSSKRSAVTGTQTGKSTLTRAVGYGGMAIGLALVFTACSSDAPASTSMPSTSSTPDSAAPTESETPVRTLALEAAGTAADNLAYFDSVASAVTAIDGRSFIDALTAAGFDKTQMEVTFDRTKADLAADTIQFAVRFNGECLLGQNGLASGGYHSAVTSPLASGTCLVGATRSIDW
jgi:hypothetical protein